MNGLHLSRQIHLSEHFYDGIDSGIQIMEVPMYMVCIRACQASQ